MNRSEIKVLVDAAVRTRSVGYRPSARIRRRSTVSLPLTRREHEVLVTLIHTPGGSPQVAAALGMAEGTLKFHLNRIYAKIGVETRTGAVAWAFANGVVQGKSRTEIWRKALVKTDDHGTVLEVVVIP